MGTTIYPELTPKNICLYGSGSTESHAPLCSNIMIANIVTVNDR